MAGTPAAHFGEGEPAVGTGFRRRPPLVRLRDDVRAKMCESPQIGERAGIRNIGSNRYVGRGIKANGRRR
jgi:hypothetical protein